MERHIALKKLGKLLGKSMGYRVDPKAPDADDRAEARAELKALIPERNSLEQKKQARMAELLRNDVEYQELVTAYRTAKKRCEELSSITMHYRFTVGTSNSFFFTVKAQGDSWEEVIEKVKQEYVAA